MQSLAVVRTGLEGEQTKMDVISNNLANINTTGFKRMRPVFSDLFYENQTQAGGFTSQATNYPSGLQQGTGANVVATEPIVTQGSLEQTGNALDLAINGQGYFQILLPSGQIAYTRDGSSRSVRRVRSSLPKATSCSRRSRFRAARRKSRLALTARSACKFRTRRSPPKSG